MEIDDPGEGSSSQDPPFGPTTARRGSNVLQATELAKIRKQYSNASTAAQSSPAIRRVQAPAPGSLAYLVYQIKKLWRNQISVVVDHEDCRDHLALERTFLGYLRTSLAISMMGVTVAQLFRLQHSPTPSPIFGFYVLGKPLACICQGTAIYALLLGAYRSWRHQNAMIRGKAISGGKELVLLAVGILMILIMFFVLLIAIDISKEG